MLAILYSTNVEGRAIILLAMGLLDEIPPLQRAAPQDKTTAWLSLAGVPLHPTDLMPLSKSLLLLSKI